MTKQQPIPVGVAEIAARSGLAEITVRKWIERHAGSATPFPASVGTVSGREAYWWHDVVDWLATTDRLTTVTHLDHPDPTDKTTITITYSPPNRSWVLREHVDQGGVRSWDEQDTGLNGRPWMHTTEEDLAADIREHLLEGWTIGARE